MNKSIWHRTVIIFLLPFMINSAYSQLTEQAAQQRKPSRSKKDMVVINYPDSVSLSAFVDYVSQSMDIKIIYGNEVKNQEVIFRPERVEIPRDQVIDLLHSMLRMSGLALVESDMDGWMRIIETDDMQRHVRDIRLKGQPISDSSNRVVTQVMTIVSANMDDILGHAKRFLSPRASVIPIPERKMVIVTDYESALAKAVDIIKLLDDAPVNTRIVTHTVQHYDAQALAEQVRKILDQKAQLSGIKEPLITVEPDLTAGRVLLVGPQEEVDEALALIARFDVPADADRDTKTYAPRYVSGDRLQRLIENVLAPKETEQGIVTLYLDQDANRLYVTGPQSVHEEIDRLLEIEDKQDIEAVRPLRIYHPKNRVASDLLNTLAEVLPTVTVTQLELSQAERAQPSQTEPAEQPLDIQTIEPTVVDGAPQRETPQITKIEGRDFSLSYDEHTNSIIAIGPREFHTKLQVLMEELDKRLPQVLIEVTLVAITFNDSFSLGVELASEEQSAGLQSLLFSSFGLSGIDLATGARTLNPGAGFNGIILGPHETPILLRAIAAHGDSRIISTPKVVVSDNTTATIRNVEESPFTSINASDTVATTSFAGFESAGTTLTATPHIAQGDHLSLDYNLSFSNFTGEGAGGVPPPRSTSSFSGSIEIPDNHTIVVGGLVTDNESDNVTEIPLVGRIPVIGALFQSSTRARTKFRVYAFIRPTILREDEFEDLKFISQNQLERAELANTDYPPSNYLWMR